MKIRFLDSVAGASFAYRRNQVVDLRIDLARGFIKAGQAVEHVDPEEARVEPVETATAAAPEAAARGGRPRKPRNLRNLGGLLP